MTFSDDLEAARVRAGSARFRIKRLALDVAADWPWQLHDHHRPYVFGHARTHRAAVLLIDAIVSGTTVVLDDDDEVIAYRPGPADEVSMRPRMLPCTVLPVMPMLEPLDFPPLRLPELDLGPIISEHDRIVRDLTQRYDTALGAALLPDCDCGSVDKYGDDIGEHSPRCPYHLAVLRLTPLVDRQTLDRVCKASLERMARRA
jgi:hypothetical protein